MKSVPVLVAQPTVVLTDIVEAPTLFDEVRYAFCGLVPEVAERKWSLLDAAMFFS
jgi:hypothetical protein